MPFLVISLWLLHDFKRQNNDLRSIVISTIHGTIRAYYPLKYCNYKRTYKDSKKHNLHTEFEKIENIYDYNQQDATLKY